MPIQIGQTVHAWERGQAQTYCGQTLAQAEQVKHSVTCQECIVIGRKRFSHNWGVWNARHAPTDEPAGEAGE